VLVIDEDDEWSQDYDAAAADQLALYEIEPHLLLTMKGCPIDYWVRKRPIWPQLAQMALDIYPMPAMRDEPERVFSATGTLLTPRRRQMTGEEIAQMTCLRSWQRSGNINLDDGLFNTAAVTTMPDDDEDDEGPVSVI
jgi:hypothetical protein